ncbi:trichoplein keratin filament-binding protein-like isoform X2 [Parambassis ranga]|uniref:Trichoplein keratin filament-binding protein-like isoform X2 n=1 Tax=Parambassis ranga TaxID=210632 RepID=A0A6P7K081_9TELE|nr:trichoplein keratin filament-binding protein-like isoform X2 [Parambassis ranga]
MEPHGRKDGGRNNRHDKQALSVKNPDHRMTSQQTGSYSSPEGHPRPMPYPDSLEGQHSQQSMMEMDLRKKLHETIQKLEETRSVLQERKKKLESFKESYSSPEGHPRPMPYPDSLGGQHSQQRSALQETKKKRWEIELEPFKERLVVRVSQRQGHHGPVEEVLLLRSPDLASRQDQSMMEMDLRKKLHETTQELEETRSALQEKKKKLESFKERVAWDVAPSIKTGKAESMNSPVNKSRLKEMYEDLRQNWIEIKDHLKSNNQNPKTVEAAVQRMFEEEREKMEQCKKQIYTMSGLCEDSSGSTSTKAQECSQIAIQNIQLALYYGNKHLLETEDVQCWESKLSLLGRLMALNNPSLQPEWENHSPGMDAWNILPTNLMPVYAKPEKCMQPQNTRCSQL